MSEKNIPLVDDLKDLGGKAAKSFDWFFFCSWEEKKVINIMGLGGHKDELILLRRFLFIIQEEILWFEKI